MANADQRSRSRKIRDLSREIDHRTHSIASSTGSNHGTVTMDLTSVFNYSELDPNDDEIFSSTNKLQYTPATRRPEIRDTAKKYGRWSPRREQTPVINTSIMDQAFKDFSGTAGGNSNTFTLDLPRSAPRSRFQPSPAPEDESLLETVVKESIEHDKENTPRSKPQSAQKLSKGSSLKGSPYISHASRNVNGERKTLVELHAQVDDDSEHSLHLKERPETLTLPSNSRFAKAQPAIPTLQEILQPQASPKPNYFSQSQRRKSSGPLSSAIQGHQVSGSNGKISIPKQRRQPSAAVARAPSQAQEQRIYSTVTSAQVQQLQVTDTFAFDQSQISKTSPTEMLPEEPARRRSQPESSFLFTPTYAPQPDTPATEKRTRHIRSNSNPTLPTHTFVIPAECAEKTKPIDVRVPVMVRDGKVEAPPVRRRRSPIDGIVIPEDEEELYRMIVELYGSIGQLQGQNESWVVKFSQLQQQHAAELEILRAEIAGMRIAQQQQQKEVTRELTRYEDDTRASSRGAHSRRLSRASSRATTRVEELEENTQNTQNQGSEHFTQRTNNQDDLTRASSRGSVSRRIDESVHNTQATNFTRDINTRTSSRASAQYDEEPREPLDELTEEMNTRVSKVQPRQDLEEVRRNHQSILEPTQNMTSAYIIEDIEAKNVHPVLSNNARQVLDGLCGHNCNNCKICVRVASFHLKAGAKHPKQTVRTEKPIPCSQRDLPYEDDPTIRPVRAPGIALASVIKGLEDEITHLKRRHAQVTNLYHRQDPAIKRKERIMICEEMGQLKSMIDVKSDQVYDLYDVLEGQLEAGQMMEQSAIDITVMEAKDEDDDTLPWEQVLDEEQD